MHNILIVFCALVAFADVATAISCYSCESTYESNCGEEFDLENYWKLDCSRVAPPRYLLPDLIVRKSTACMKRIYEESGVRHVMRSCFFGDVNNDTDIGCQADPSLIAPTKEIECLVCNDVNYCNKAPTVRSSEVALGSSLMVFGLWLTRILCA